MRVIPILASIACLASTSCNEVSRKDGYPARYANAICGVLGPCCVDNGLEFDHDSCVLGGAGYVQSGVDAATRAGATFDPAAADACISGAVRLARSCLPIKDDPATAAACSSVWIGIHPPGSTCTGDLDCAPTSEGRGACYILSSSPDGGVSGVCVVKKRPASTGDLCGVASGAPPPVIADCAGSGLQCDFGSRTCRPTGTGASLGAGAPCRADPECTSGACIRGACANNGVGGLTPCTGAKQ